MTRPRILLGLTALAALGGCQTLEEIAQPAKPVAAPSHPTYCYRTLASVNCYLAPRPGDTLVGIDVPPPVQPAPAKPSGPHSGQPATSAPPGGAPPAPTAMPATPPPVTSEPAATPSSGPAQLSPYGNGGRRGTE